ncbi:unnamed protein product [Cyprideis torosa]|uniref:Uncharacterized protein n=1 Tax=Cyprideis torosa TaxID=163714 RepID=A0A7R8ZKX6_9CRUS|nr:unnamed protein product [Cyprideis torosa]CAG0890437.1 unnamed protein product [Cyprideis torosa]
MNARVVKRASDLLIGQCFPSTIRGTAKVYVKRMILNDYLKMHFPEWEVLYAYDPQKSANVGDFVLIEELKELKSKRITHRLKEVVFPCGDITDPVTGEKVMGDKYRYFLERERQLIGPAPGASGGFDYATAPPRGQGTDKDKSMKDVYIRYDARIKDDYAY